MARPVAATSALPALRLALVALAGAGLLAGLAFLALVLGSDHTDDRGVVAAVGLVVGWSFIGTGLFAWWRRPGNRTGALMVAVGFAWFATGVSASDQDLVFTAGIALDALLFALAGHLVLAFPSGHLQTKTERGVVGAGHLVVTVLQVPALLFEEEGGEEPRNLLMIEPDRRLSDALDAVQAAAAVAVIVASLTILVRPWRTATPPQRRALAPVMWTGAVAFAVFAVVLGFDAAGNPQDRLQLFALVLLATVPFGFLAGLLRSRLVQATAVSELVARLGHAPEPEALRSVLADALGDPSLALAYWLPEPGRFVDASGRPVVLQAGAWTEVELHGQRIAAIAHDPSLADEPQLVRAAGAAAALALENQRLSAELRANIEELRASRARLVEAGDAERRRLERDLHDGAQSRLVALAVKLRLARMKASDEREVAAILDESSAELQASLNELRELARGIHPAVLTDRGLGAALEMLASRAPPAGADRRRAARRASSDGYDGDLLRRLRGAHQRRQVRPRELRDGRRAAHGGHRRGRGLRRRRRRCRPRRWLRPEGIVGPRRRARRPPGARQPAGRGHAGARADPRHPRLANRAHPGRQPREVGSPPAPACAQRARAGAQQ
jgi:signal transduction histidine kinase